MKTCKHKTNLYNILYNHDDTYHESKTETTENDLEYDKLGCAIRCTLDAGGRLQCLWKFNDVDDWFTENILDIISFDCGTLYMLYTINSEIVVPNYCTNKIIKVKGIVKISPYFPIGTSECITTLLNSGCMTVDDFILGVKYGIQPNHVKGSGRDFQFPITGGVDEFNDNNNPDNTFLREVEEELGLKYKGITVEQLLSSYNNYTHLKTKTQKVSIYAHHISKFDVVGMKKSIKSKRTNKSMCGIIYGSKNDCYEYMNAFPINNSCDDDIIGVSMIKVSEYMKMIDLLEKIKNKNIKNADHLRCLYINIL